MSFVGHLEKSTEYSIIEINDSVAVIELNDDLGSVISKIQETAEILEISVNKSLLDDIVIKLYEDYNL